MKTTALKMSLALVVLACAGVSAQPIVEISKTCPELRYLGRNATFEITVRNRGNSRAQGVVVKDTITGGVKFVKADNGGKRDGDDIVWHLDTLEAGQTKVLKATMNCGTIGTVSSSASVSYCAEETASCSFPVKGIPAILLECVDAPDPTEVGDQLTYTITVLNQGSAPGTNIVIDCTLPAEEEYVSSDGPTKAAVSGKSVKFAPIPVLAPKATAEFNLKVKAVSVGDVRFKVEMTSDQLSRPVMETESTNLY